MFDWLNGSDATDVTIPNEIFYESLRGIWNFSVIKFVYPV